MNKDKKQFYHIAIRDFDHPLWAMNVLGPAVDLSYIMEQVGTKDQLKCEVEKFVSHLRRIRTYTQEDNPLEYNKEQVECIPDDEHLTDFVMSQLEFYKYEGE